MIIALAHKKRVGKDTAATILTRYFRQNTVNKVIDRVALADQLKQVCYKLYGWAGLQEGIAYETGLDKEEKLPLLGLSPREIWIHFGMSVRELYPDTWCQLVFEEYNSDVLIISDCRFKNEIDIIKSKGGIIVKIERDIDSASDIADEGLDGFNDWDHVIDNNGSLKEFRDQVIALGEQLCIE